MLSKSYVDFFDQAYANLLEDIASAFPCLRQECERDLARLQLLIRTRGLRGLAIDLPAAGKHFDRCLSTQQYDPVSLPFTGLVSERIKIPKFLRGLMLLVFDENGKLKENADVVAIQLIRQVYYLGKKLSFQCSCEDTNREIEEFLAVDTALPEPSGFWESSDEDHPAHVPGLSFSEVLQRTPEGLALLREDRSLGERLDKTFAFITASLGRYEPSEHPFRHGPGATSAGPSSVNKYKWYSWPRRLDDMFPASEYAYHSYSSWAANHTEIPEGEEPSRLIAVPKTLDKPRLIAAEPSSHQWCQQNMKAFMERGVQTSWIRSFINFRSQEQNQELCRKGSLDGSLATLDLSAASDRVTCDVVECAFRGNPNLLCYLRACRTRYVRVEGKFGPNRTRAGENQLEFLHRVKKFSTMGSACTFPVESLIFLGICLACLSDGSPKAIRRLSGSVSVFGDDIIIPTHARDLVTRLLEALWFKVNTTKSFSEGNFRESCGVDAFRGVNVTPVYLRHASYQTPESMVGGVEAANHFYKRWLLNVSDFLRRTVRIKFPDVHPDSGVLGFICRTRPVLRKQRWNGALQRYECKVAQPTARQTKHKAEDDSRIFQYFTDNPDPTSKWEPGWCERPVLSIQNRWVDSHDLYRSWLEGCDRLPLVDVFGSSTRSLSAAPTRR